MARTHPIRRRQLVRYALAVGAAAALIGFAVERRASDEPRAGDGAVAAPAARPFDVRLAELEERIGSGGRPAAGDIARLYDLDAELQSGVEALHPADPGLAQLWVEALQLLAKQPADSVVPRDPIERWRRVVDVAYCNDVTLTRADDLVAAVEGLGDRWVGDDGVLLRRRLRYLVEDASIVAEKGGQRVLRRLLVRLTQPDDPAGAARIEEWEDALGGARDGDDSQAPADPAGECERRFDALYRRVVAERRRGPVEPWLDALRFAERHEVTVRYAKRLAWIAHSGVEGFDRGYALLHEALRLSAPGDHTRLRLAQARIAGLGTEPTFGRDRAADLVELEVARIRRAGATAPAEVAGAILDRVTAHLRPVAMVIWPADRAIDLGRPDLARAWVTLAAEVAEQAHTRYVDGEGSVVDEARIGVTMARMTMARWANAVDWPERLGEVVDIALQGELGLGQRKQLLFFKAAALTYEFAGRRDRGEFADEAADLASRCLDIDVGTLPQDRAGPLRQFDRAAYRLLAYLAALQGERERAEACIGSARAIDVPAEPAGSSDEPLLLEAVAARLALDRSADLDELIRLRDALESALEPMLAHAAGVPIDQGGVGFLHFGARRAAISELIRLHRAIAARRGEGAVGNEAVLRLLLRVQSAGTLSRRLGAGSVDLEDLRRLLPDDGAMLFYLPAVERSHLLVVDGRGIEHFDLSARDEIVAAVQELAVEVAASPHGADAARLAEIRAALLGVSIRAREELLPSAALARLRDARTWIVVGTEMLDHPVFEALWMDAEGFGEHGGWLGTERALCYLPSVPLGQALARRRAAERADDGVFRSVVIGAPVAPELDALDPAMCERAFGAREGGERTVFVGGSATRGALRAVADLDPDALTVVAHGIDADRGPGFVLAPGGTGGRVDALDLGRLRLPPVVTLLVCGAAKGLARRGDDTLNLLCDAAFRAGAATVVASAGQLAYAPTLTLAAGFDDRLASGDGVAEAMRAARAALLRSGDADHPFYFAQLRVFGLPGR